MTTSTPPSASRIGFTPPIRVMIVDDHQVVRMGLSTVLGFQPDLDLVAEAEDAQQALDAYREHRPDVVLMDLRIPGGGLEATRAIRALDGRARILILTTYDTEENVHQCMDAGACGFLLKSSPAPVIIESIRKARQGATVLSDDLQQKLKDRAAKPELTARELEVLGLVVRGLSNREIAERLGFTEHTAKAHVKQILAKMGADDRTEASTEAIRRGLIVMD